MFGWFRTFLRLTPARRRAGVSADRMSVAAGRDIRDSTINIGLDEAAVGRRIAAATRPMDEKLDAVLAQVARDKGVEIPPLRAILAKLGEAGIPDAEIVARLDAAADQLIELRKDLSRLRNDRPEFAAIRARALALIDRGDLDAARAALAGGRETARAAREDLSRDEAAFLAEEARIDHLQLAYQAAAQKYADAAGLVRAFDRDGTWGYLLQQADALYHQGNEFGDNEALIQSIGVYRDALSFAPRDRVPLDWAATQNNLGIALATLGEREASTTRLEAAIAAFRAALRERTRDRVSRYWAATQNNLGNALATLGELENTTERLGEAVIAFRDALRERTHDRDPLNWAMTQNNLGSVLKTIGEREKNTARLEEAVTAFDNALTEWTRDRVPLQWAKARNNLGAVLGMLGTQEKNAARLEEAVTAFGDALTVWTRDRVPLDWATTQNNLGGVLATLGELENNTGLLKKAVIAFRDALQERTRDRVPGDWAMTQYNLGNALRALGARESGTARLEAAIAAWEANLTVSASPPEWVQQVRDQIADARAEIARRRR
jgi:tetratricopeptide (TPR) repeat protein